jgi:hypothetical protein
VKEPAEGPVGMQVALLPRGGDILGSRLGAETYYSEASVVFLSLFTQDPECSPN